MSRWVVESAFSCVNLILILVGSASYLIKIAEYNHFLGKGGL